MRKLKAEIRLIGIVQGVGFRPFIYRLANRYRLKGFVRNLKDATLLIAVEGFEEDIRLFVESILREKPPAAKIDKLEVKYSEELEGYVDFKILSSSDTIISTGSMIPADIAICDDCVKELMDKENRRYRYFFITCTNCGPRFTIIYDTPYDRQNTSMVDFPMCYECLAEYENPFDRRFHAQTIACPVCGPKLHLFTKDGELVDVKDPIKEAANLIDEGNIIAIKGIGGYHIATATTFSEPILRLRKVKHREQKPFAIMAKDLETVKTFAIVNEFEEKLLTSPMRPIVLLKKSENYYLSDAIAPGLHNIGVMLPYTGLHVLLLSYSKEPAYVMTSGNSKGEPIIKDDEEAFRKLSRYVDYLLVNDRKIVNRCDDSVVKVIDGNTHFIRRSRGYAPEPIRIPMRSKCCTMALGGELNVTGCIVLDDKAFLTQHIGDVEYIDTYSFLKDAIKQLKRLTKASPEVIVHDLHPGFLTTKLAKELSEEFHIPSFAVQHHYAHIASVMAEHGLENVLGVGCDGFGYGEDGMAWGGEIMLCNWYEYRRVGHLEEHPMPGGDLAAKYPLRMAIGILSNSDKDLCERFLESKHMLLPKGYDEAMVILKQARSSRTIKTSSAGRFLDAVAAVLGICYERTYEGEPAMKLEAMAIGGEDTLMIDPLIKNGVLITGEVFSMIVERSLNSISMKEVKDLAFSVHKYLAEGLAEISIEVAQKEGIKKIAFSGGVAYNEIITSILKRKVTESGLSFYTNMNVPHGDGGLSFGQAVVAAVRFSH